MGLSDFNLITDRTQADVDHYIELRDKGFRNMTDDEKIEWLGIPLKGSYTPADMNRVESAVEYVANELTSAGYVVSPVVKKDWNTKDKPTTNDIKRYMKNVLDIRNALGVFYNIPDAPTTEQRLNYQIANDIEWILVVVDDLITRMVSAYFYSGDLYSGEA